MNLYSSQSLEHRAVIKCSLMLLNEKFWSQIMKCPIITEDIYPNIKYAEDKIKKNISKLCIPEFLKQKISITVKEICMEIIRWRHYHEMSIYLGKHKISKLCWKPQGIVDKKKTAQLLIKDKYRLERNLNILKRYKLACIYCLEDDIDELWGKMSEEQRESYKSFEEILVFSHSSVSDEHLLVLYWIYWKSEDCHEGVTAVACKMCSKLERTQDTRTTFQCIFEYAVAIGNEVAAEFFWKKLTSVEREESLIRSAGYAAVRRMYSRTLGLLSVPSVTNKAPNENFTNILCFLLSKMNRETQKKVFKMYPCEVLECLLDWPWQELFMETASCLWEYLDKEKSEHCLKAILDRKVRFGCTNYQYLFKAFWKCCPVAHKKYMIDDRAGGDVLFYLFRTEDEKLLKLFFGSASISERRKFIFGDTGKDICKHLIREDKWNLIGFFIRECISSKSEMRKLEQKFKEEFNALADDHPDSRFVKDKEKKFLNLLKYFDHEDVKRKREETEGSVPGKRR